MLLWLPLFTLKTLIRKHMFKHYSGGAPQGSHHGAASLKVERLILLHEKRVWRTSKMRQHCHSLGSVSLKHTMNLEAQNPTQNDFENPEMPKKHAAFTRTCSKSSCKLLSFPCDRSQEPDGNCSEKLIQMNFFIWGGFFGVVFPHLSIMNV